jgi:hypothetical protein
MRFIGRIFDWMGRVLLPVRLRPTVLATRAQSALDRAAGGLEGGVGKAGRTVERIESGEHPRPSALATFVRWLVHFLIVIGILVGLYFLNSALQLEQVLRSPFPTLHRYWLPLLFLILYVMAWLGWWLWELTGPDKVVGDYPEINLAWAEVMHAVAAAGVDMREVPLFLVLGRPGGAEDAVFDAAGLPWRPVPPRRVHAPLHVYVTADAVFLTCTGASVFGRLTELIAEDLQHRPEAAGEVEAAPPDVEPAPTAEPSSVVEVTVESAEAPVAPASSRPARAPGELTEEERRVIGLLVAEEEAEKPRAEEKRRALLRNTVEIEALAGRLRHLCRLIVRDRRPYCPVNGALVLIPQAALDSDAEASQAATACAQDLEIVGDELRVQCPAFALVCDLDRSAGFREFLARLPSGQRDRRLGQRFPLVPDVEETAVPQMVQDGVGWLSHAVLPALVYNLFRTEPAGNGSPAVEEEVLQGNLRLFELLATVRERRRRLGRFLTRGLLLDERGPFMLGGVYLGGTGEEEGQAFVSGVFQRLEENQNNVAWTHEALVSEARYRRWSRVVWLATLLLIVGGLGLTYFLWLWW